MITGTGLTGRMLNCRKWDSQFESIMNIGRTLFILAMLSLGAMLFSRDANRLVLIPIDRMVQRVKALCENPLQKVRADSTLQRPASECSHQLLEHVVHRASLL